MHSLSPGAYALLSQLRDEKRGGQPAPKRGLRSEHAELRIAGLLIVISGELVLTLRGEAVLRQKFVPEN